MEKKVSSQRVRRVEEGRKTKRLTEISEEYEFSDLGGVERIRVE